VPGDWAKLSSITLALLGITSCLNLNMSARKHSKHYMTNSRPTLPPPRMLGTPPYPDSQRNATILLPCKWTISAKVFLASLRAKLADQPAPSPHAACHKLITARSGTIFSTVSSRVEAGIAEQIRTHSDTLRAKAYKQAKADIALRYPASLMTYS